MLLLFSEICKNVIIKYNLEEGKLPRKIAEEILTMELKLKKELDGEYRMHEFEPEFDHNNPTALRIDWSHPWVLDLQSILPASHQDKTRDN